MSVIYLAGPMRGYDFQNAPAFDAASAHLRSLGNTVISPPEEDKAAGEAYMLEVSKDHQFSEKELARVILRDCSIVCNKIDAIALLPNWFKSKGARVEFALSEFMSRQFLNSAGEEADLVELKRDLARQLLIEADELEKSRNLVS